MPFPPVLRITALAAIASLAACGKSGNGGGSNVALHDMEVVDGTANDAMTDLDNVAGDGTPMIENSGVHINQSAPAKPKADANAPVDESTGTASNSSTTAPE